MWSRTICKYENFVLIIYVAYLTTFVQGFNVGIRGTTCSLDPSENQNACKSLYDAECDGAHCKCPSGTHEDKALKRCVPGAGPPKKSQGHDDFGDLPFDFVPGKKPEPKPAPVPKTPDQPPQQPAPPPPVQPRPAQPQAPVEDPHLGEKAGGGIGGGIGFLILAGLVYFCCCRGEKGQNLRSKLPFFKGGGSQPGANYQMQEPQPGQYPNAPPPAAQ